VRALLQNHGYEALSTCRVHDAKTLLSAASFDYIVLGPDTSHLPSDNVVAKMKSLAPTAATVQLPDSFKYDDPERAGLDLLRIMQSATKS